MKEPAVWLAPERIRGPLARVCKELEDAPVAEERAEELGLILLAMGELILRAVDEKSWPLDRKE